MLIAMGITFAAGLFLLFGITYFIPPVEADLHKHVYLTVIESNGIDAEQIVIPDNIGNQDGLWFNHEHDSFGLDGFSPLHTHDTMGIIHVELNEKRDFTLQDFLNIWGYDVGENPIVKLDGQEFELTPEQYTMGNDDRITMFITKP